MAGNSLIRIFRPQSNGQYSPGQQAAGTILGPVGTAAGMSNQGITYYQNPSDSSKMWFKVETAQLATDFAGKFGGKVNPYLGFMAFGLKLYEGKELSVSDYAGLAASALSLLGPVGIAAGALVTVAGVAYEVYSMNNGKEIVVEEKNPDFVPLEYYEPYYELPLKYYPDVDPETPNIDPATKVKSPLAIDLDGDGIATYALKNGVYFDIDSDGFAEKTAWLNAKDAFLAIDRNKNGIIDDASELFGDSDKAANGFEALKAMDTNGDGVIDANDAGWEDLMLWIDAINDGVSQENELITAADAGIAYIELNYKNQDVTDENGNQHRQTATVHWQDGHTTVIEDIWFQTNQAQSIDLTGLNVSNEEWAELAELPYIDAFGDVHSLWVAMSLDACSDEFFTKSSDFQAA